MPGRRRRSRTTHRQHHRTEPGTFIPDTVLYVPPRKTHRGITRSTRERTAPTLPITESQAEVLLLLTTELQRPSDLARTLGRSPAGVTASLYGLQDRRLAEKVPFKGWRRTTTAGDADATEAPGPTTGRSSGLHPS